MESEDTATLSPARPNIESDSEADGAGGRIRCPICGWTPRSEDRWMCQCAHLWNTFDTGGVCPSCLMQWAFTACPACKVWSPHSDWYARE
jgi:hypothetical protein